mmetsp:Transcript_4837/g.14659  ORF Transcript_4837/g.14659 Transcript_4837/m.14659 type:complete len:159 (+) Transcript_4837:42-518(+)
MGLRTAWLVIAACGVADALYVVPQPVAPRQSVVRFGFMDMIKNAFSNELFDDRRVRASHILVKSEDECQTIKTRIDAGETDFAEAAKEFSKCPSAKNGGSLGAFGPGKMVPQFDEVCFDEAIPVGTVVGPVKTVFGYHLVQVEDRFENTVKSEGSSVF